MVQDYSGDHDYEAWGHVDGDTFCCAIDDTNPITAFEIIGSDAADQLHFTWNSNTDNLLPAGVSSITAKIRGAGDDDLITGSDYGGAGYAETLEGGADDDTILGNRGDDILNGDAGADTMLGGAGVDTMDGGAGDDTMLGGNDDDTMDGGADDDGMSGGEGDDTMDGGTGSDSLCGNGAISGDILTESSADGAVDYLWGAVSSDEEYCFEASTYWSGNPTINTCTGNTELDDPPAGCP